MPFTMKELIEREASSVWRTIREDKRLELTLEEFTSKVNNTDPRRNYTESELKPIFENLRSGQMECPKCHKIFKVVGADPATLSSRVETGTLGMVHNLRHKCGCLIRLVRGNTKPAYFAQRPDGGFEPSSTECFLDLADSAE